jgi:hypothetical protein
VTWVFVIRCPLIFPVIYRFGRTVFILTLRFFHAYSSISIVPSEPCFDQHRKFGLSSSIWMDRVSRISRSSDSSGDSSSSTGSFTPIPELNDEKASGDVTSPTPQDLRVELSRLKMALASHEHTLVERSNHLSRLVGEVDSKDHQLALANRQIQLRDLRIAELEKQLADVYKSRAQEAYGEHAKARLLVDTERECRQLRRRCRFWRSRALGKSRITGDISRDERSD